MSLPKEPRQLMINLMYLVLTALLALNVSSEILNAFKTIDKSIANSNKSVEARNSAVTDGFQKYLDDPKTNTEKRQKVSNALLLAQQVNDKTKVVLDQIDRYKQMIIDASGGMQDGQIKRIDDLDAGTRVMIEEGNGPKLLQMLKTYKDEIAGLVPIDDQNIIAPGIGNNPEVFALMPLSFETEKTDDNPSGDWSYMNFNMSPTIACVTLLDKYKSDVLASQSIALEEIWSKATGEKVDKVHVSPRPFNDYAIIVSADNNYVLPGEKYRARVMMGTYNKNINNLSFVINGRTIIPVNGVAEYSEIASTVGTKNINVTAYFNDTIPGTKQVQRRTITLDKPSQYFVGDAQASISLDKMNVFYIGVDNPITMSASGITSSNLTYSAENCTLTKAEGINKYIVRVTQPGRAKISLTGKLADGTTKALGTYEYRVKIIPDPYPVVANRRGGSVSASELRVQEAIFAKLDNFDFDVKFEVTSFEVTYQKRRSSDLETATSANQYLTGPKADRKVAQLVENVSVGDRIYFENIKARGPDGRTRNIGSVNLIINN
jgi:hypothetical protein